MFSPFFLYLKAFLSMNTVFSIHRIGTYGRETELEEETSETKVLSKGATRRGKLSDREPERQSFEINLCITHTQPLMVSYMEKRLGVMLAVF